jgi:lipopolysaccharide/colanic/teichoic acid biosynthesis glycosyltransferase
MSSVSFTQVQLPFVRPTKSPVYGPSYDSQMTSAHTHLSLYSRYGKRALDITLSLLGLLVLAPFLMLIGLCIKCTSRGPILFRQVRVGQNARLFEILKFRSMIADAETKGLGITAVDDCRITPFGCMLREYKIDELPQLYNVLKGDMSLVGPRPELPMYVEQYSPEERNVLSVRPGLTDPASLFYCDEGRLLAESPDPEHLYRHNILPHKLLLNLKYIESVSLKHDTILVLSTVWHLLPRSLSKNKHHASA